MASELKLCFFCTAVSSMRAGGETVLQAGLHVRAVFPADLFDFGR